MTPRSSALASAAAILVGFLTGCATSAPPTVRAAARTTSPPPAVVVVTTTAARAPTRTPTPAAPAQGIRRPSPAARTSSPARPAAPPLLVTRLHGVGSARQVVSVTNGGYGDSYATVRAFTRTASGWTQTFGPWQTRIGMAGFAPPGEKREGDDRTPTGSYGFQFMFGVAPDPGVRFPYRHITGSYLVWDDDPSSPAYNTLVDTRTADAGRSPEPMYVTPAYTYGVVIGYNTARTPGLGSAIFLHQQHEGATTGCVELPQDELLPLLRWLDPSNAPRIVMGPESVVAG
jgi:L,D-peptidoglycan transpeptidase YkuD (ErfK/YbiS/YcfS/YnhG family)